MRDGAQPGRRELEARAQGYIDPDLRADVAHLSDRELARLVGDLDRTVRPCGCKEGAIGVSAAFVLWPVWVALRRRPSTLLGWTGRALELVPVTAVGALTFKGAGIARGRAEHRRLRRRLLTPTGEAQILRRS